MKKLMFGAALAATSMAFADTSAGQVYDVTLSIKSTAAAKATINNKTNPFLGEDKDEVIYRKQASYTWKGLIWGCSCEGIDGVWEEAYTGTLVDYSSIKGCILWDTKAKEAVYIGNGADINDPADAVGKGFGWDFINAIDKNGKKVEGSWAMTQEGTLCDEDATLFDFRGAGFGTLNVVGTDEDSCGDNYLKSISGNFAGWMVAPDETSVKNPTGCMFCGYEEGSSTCFPSTVWDYCPCLAIADDTRTAAYGTWKISYNSSLSKKLSKPLSVSKKGVEGVIVSITDVYNFKSLPLVAAKITAIENEIWEYDPTGCDDLESALTAAKKALSEANDDLEDAKDALEELSDENLANAYYAAVEAASVSRTNAAAFAATTNLFGVSTLAGFKANNGLQIASKVVRDPITHEVVETVFDWDTTLEDNDNIYNTGVGGTTNAVLAAKAGADEAWDAVNTNRYVITIDGEEAIKYGSKDAAAYIAAQYSKTAVDAKIAVTAYTDSVGTTVDPTRTIGETAFTDKAIVEKYNAYATADAAALVKANTALETAQDANATATAAFKVFCETAYAAREAESTALNRYSNRKILRAAAQEEVDAAQKKVDAAQTVVDAKQKAYDDAGCND